MKLPVMYRELRPFEKRRVREEYTNLQEGKCVHCKGLLTEEPIGDNSEKPLNLKLFPKGFLNYPVHLHHDHDTGLTIGAVHARCNGILWEYYGE